MTAFSRAAAACLALVALGLGLTTRGDERERGEIAPRPPAWDEEAAARFAARGVAVPRTVLTTETEGELDLSWIRSAFGFATPISPAERQRLESQGGGGEGEGAPESGAAPAPRPATPPPAGATAPQGMPTPEEMPRASEGAEGGRAAPRGDRERARRSAADDAPAPDRGPSFGGADEGAGGLDMELSEAQEEADEAHEPGSKAGEVPRPVLSRIESSARGGKILFQNAQGGYEALEARGQRVVVFVEGGRARTVVDLVFRNPHDRRLQGTFYYPLPDGASPAGFGMFPGTARVEGAAALPGLLPPLPLEEPRVGDLTRAAPQAHRPLGGEPVVQDWQPMQLARVVEQKRARQVYEDVVRGQVDPALLEWSGGNTFQARVFPIEPGSLKRVVLAFEQALPRDGELLRWVHPLSGEPGLGAVDAYVYLRRELVGPAAGLPEDPQAIRRPLASEEVGAWTRLHLQAPAGFRGAFDLPLRPAGDVDALVLGGVAPGLPGRVYQARVTPEVPGGDAAPATGRAVFLVDTSLSEDGVRRSISGELLLRILEGDETIQEYAVLLFDIRARWLHAVGWRPNTPERRAETRAELERVYLEGATHFAAVLDELVRQAPWVDPAGQQPATRFLLSDGLITWGQDRVEPLLNEHRAALAGRFLCYRLGDAAVNRDLFDALARGTAGRTVTVLGPDQVAPAAQAHRRAPVLLKEVRVAGGPAVDLAVAGDPRLVFPGQELEVAFRSPDGAAEALEVVLECAGQEQVTRVPLPRGAEHALAPRAWAEQWVRHLLALDDERLDRMVVALSQAFGLANQAASLLILEGDQDWVRFDLKDEQVDLADLARLRAVEEDQRRDRLQGIALDDVPVEGRELVRLLGAHDAPPTQPALPLLDRPLAGGAARIEAEVAYRAARAKAPLDVQVYDAVARARALAGDTCGAVRALSSLVEQRPRDAEANRLVGYACLALGQYGAAAELFERVRLNRPFEPQSYLEEALALEALGRWSEAARAYEIVWARSFPRHERDCKVTAAFHYARMLRGRLREGSSAFDPPARAAVEARLAALGRFLGEPLERTPLQLTIHWNTDSTDIDLWVVEPEGERCFYGHMQTGAGGRLYWDTTTGYGPELYRRGAAGRGLFDVLIHFYGNNSPRWTVPTSVLLVRDRDLFGPEDGYTRRFQMRILPASDAVLRLRKETF